MEAKLGLFRTDCEAIISHEKHKEKILKLKRRWLLGLPFSKSDDKKFHKYVVSRFVPESLQRDDDIFYEKVKEYVEEAFGLCNAKREAHIVPDSKLLLDRTKMKRMLLSRVDALNNKGLHLVAKLLTGGAVNFETARKKMKEVIKQSRFLRDQNCDQDQTEILMLLYHLINSPQNFRENCLALANSTFQSHHSAAIQVLNGLEDLPTEALLAMRRKLSGVPASIPCLLKKKYNRRRDSVIHYIRNTSEKMLSETGRGEELQEPLAKSLAIAGLSVMQTSGSLNSSVTDFSQFSPEIKVLQNEILKAIWLLGKKKLKLQEVQTLQLLLDPNANVPKGSLRTAMNKLLTEYLFECSEFNTIPKPLTEALAIINRSSCKSRSRCHPKEQIEEEVECILGLSSEIKQGVWDIFPHHELDEDFADAYVEESEESDCGDDDFISDHHKIGEGKSYSIDWNYQEESCGEYIPLDSSPPISNPDTSCGPTLFHETRIHNAMHNEDVNKLSIATFGTSSVNEDDFSLHHSPNERSKRHSSIRNQPEQGAAIDQGNSQDVPPPSTFCLKGKNTSGNLYLGIQEVCDDTSMVAYNLIGYLMEGLARKEGLDLDWGDISYLRGDKSIKENQEERRVSSENIMAGSHIAQIVEELLPSLPQSESKRLKELMAS
ncbi:DNA DOUBLE-STRAND BREAK REPAIR PROTEIN [Salix purpurea]|uniref:DNA DOUBLE-STRAND BREAK REPAIR PROTEIN n=1 Tax=Salix purpurea TaxID=77065 RepID=A0A9Q0ZH34_SALPP|nr:DNA DOUBLE-STRAND BREAK REPAIR PROTEIN [Salix purpurea]KAJ6734157.1 DNA DOUBLE-STRAND BREAK REPAIR PROTEIN [Salix purpurea]KAJ6734158.1 DNA DOUBLE-STRAND BREAK REPAIR PROTEIN [Salix purpurea]